MSTHAPPRPTAAAAARRHPRRPPVTDQQRVPPHDLDAERALLGAAMLSTDAALVLTGVPAADFYRPAHGHIAAAIQAVHRRGDPVDPVVVAAELRQAGLLDDAGGAAELVTLMAGTPATTSAARYAGIVRDHAATRRVMHIASELLERGYAGAPAADLLTDAHDRLKRVAPTGDSTLSWADVAAILANGTAPTIDPDFLRRSDGQPLLYAGRIHAFQAEPTSGKSFIALYAALELLQIGSTVVYLDLEDTDSGILGRLLALGATADQLTHQFRLVRPTGALTEVELADLEARAADINPDLVIIDGVAEALANDGLDENDNIAVVTWINRVPKRLAASTGAAVVLIDHVAKSKEDRGRWMRGAGAKLGAVDGAAYELRVVEPFSRDHPGHVRLIVAKDRPGAVGPTGATAANVYIDPTGHGAVVRIRLDPPSSDEADGKPTMAMTEISKWIQQHGPAPEGDIAAAFARFKGPTIRAALLALLTGQYVRQTRNDKRRQVLVHVRPYPDRTPLHEPDPQARLELADDDVVDLEEWKRRNF